MTTFADIDALIAKKSLLLHPFYVRWSKGELTLQDLKVYAKEYFHLVERIPGVVAHVRDRAKDAQLRAQMEENFREEQEHIELWKRFAKSLGISEAELKGYVPSAKVTDAVKKLEKLAEQGLEEGAATMYALEAELPKIAQTKKEGLAEFYGLTSEDAQIYFDEHLKEEKHIQVWRSIPLNDNAKEAADESLNAQNLVLDAVCDACNIPLHC
jgi:pyrroloquinoline-quinone synthase